MMMSISIRHTEPEDYPSVQKIYADPHVIWGTMQRPYPSAASWRKRLANPSDDLINLVACSENGEGENQEGEIVGQLTLQTFPTRPRRKHVGYLGMAVRSDWHNKGVGSALMTAIIDLADNWLNLTRLELHVYTDNTHAIYLYKKHHFIIEGTCQQHSFRNGRYADTYAMARLKNSEKDAVE